MLNTTTTTTTAIQVQCTPLLRERSVPKITINFTVKFFLKL